MYTGVCGDVDSHTQHWRSIKTCINTKNRFYTIWKSFESTGNVILITQCYLQITPYIPLPRKGSPDGASPDWGCGHLIAAYYSFIYPKRMKGWVSLVGWPTADGLPTYVVTRQPQVERRTAKVRLSETDVLLLYHATNLHRTPIRTLSQKNS